MPPAPQGGEGGRGGSDQPASSKSNGTGGYRLGPCVCNLSLLGRGMMFMAPLVCGKQVKELRVTKVQERRGFKLLGEQKQDHK